MTDDTETQTRHVRFQRYIDAGFPVDDLVPIIPPGAVLIPGTTIDPSQCGKIPGVCDRTTGMWHGIDWLHARFTDKGRAWSERHGCGIGIVGRHVIGLDIDITDGWLSREVVDLARRELGWSPVRTGQAPKRMLVYRMADGELIDTWLKAKIHYAGAEQLIEVRGSRQQFVVEGIHPGTGRPYSWDENLADVGMAGLSTVTRAELERFFEAVRADLDWLGVAVERVAGGGSSGGVRGGVDQLALRAADLDEAENLVARLPNQSHWYPTRDDYIRMGYAIRAAFRDDPARGLAAWQEWCARWDDGDNDPAVVEADWRRMRGPYEIGIDWLRREAVRTGAISATERAQAAFAGVDVPVDGTTDNGRQSAAQGATRATGTEFWDRWVFVRGQEMFYDLTKDKLVSQKLFAAEYRDRIGRALSGTRSAVEIYQANGAKRRFVDDLTYRPGAGRFVTEPDGRKCINQWRPGPGAEWSQRGPATDADIAIWLDLVHRHAPDDATREHWLDMMAWIVQHPDRKINHHAVLVGQQGVGKDTVIMPLVRGMGPGARLVQGDALLRQWTDWYQRAALVVLEEVHTAQRREVGDRLKPMMTDPPESIEINAKYLHSYPTPNVANFILLSNHLDALCIEPSDRRLFVIESAFKRSDVPGGYFRAVYEWYDAGGIELVWRWLACRDVSQFNPKGEAPMTAAREAMRALSLGVVESRLMSAIEEKEGPFERDLVTLAQVREWLRQDDPATARKISDTRLGHILREIGCEQLPRTRLPVEAGGKLIRPWAVRRLGQWREAEPRERADVVDLQQWIESGESSG